MRTTLTLLRKFRACFPALLLIFAISFYNKSVAQYVPPVGPSGCVELSGTCGPVGSGMGSGMGQMDMGEMFGGIAIGIGMSILFDYLSKLAEPQATTSAQLTDQQIEMQRALEEQRRIQQERHNNLIANLTGIPTSDLGLLGIPGELTLLGVPDELTLLDGELEILHAAAGRAFDGTDPHAFWMRNHNAWFSTLGYSAQPISTQPMPVGDQTLNYSDEQFESLECVAAGPYGGQLCPFPNMKGAALDVQTLNIQSPTTMTDVTDIISQFSQSDQGSVYSFQHSWSNVSAPNPQVPDVMTNLVNSGGQPLPGIQGQGQLAGAYTEAAKQVFNGLNQDLLKPGATSLLLREVPQLPTGEVLASIDRIEVPVPDTTITQCEGVCWLKQIAAEKMWDFEVWHNDPLNRAALGDAITMGTIFLPSFIRGMPKVITRAAPKLPTLTLTPPTSTAPKLITNKISQILVNRTPKPPTYISPANEGYMPFRNRLAQKWIDAGVSPERIMKLAPPRGTVGDSGNVFPPRYWEQILKVNQ